MDIDFGIVAQRAHGTHLKVTLNSFKGQLYLHIRDYGIDEDTYITYPLPKGITIPLDSIDILIEKLEEASKYLADLARQTYRSQLEFDFYNKKEDNN